MRTPEPDVSLRTRRALLGEAIGAAALLASAGPLAGAARATAGAAPAAPATRWSFPAETGEHERTWMAWPARRDVWGKLLAPVRADVAAIARTIARYEPVSMVARPAQAKAAQAACGPGVEVVEIENDDLWMRDIGPLFLTDGKGGLAGLDMNFNGWGHKQVHRHDTLVARRILETLGVQRIAAPFVAEGGALEMDGEGTLVATESSLVNPNRNPHLSRAQLTGMLMANLGVEKVLWVRGLAGHDITDDHIDSLARFVGGGEVVLDAPATATARGPWARSERQALTALEADSDALGRPLRCRLSRESATIPAGQDPDEFVNVYVNWYVCNGAVLIPSFGDHAGDAAAHELVAELYPGRVVEQLRIDSLAAGGGGIHCATQQQPVIIVSP